MEGTFLDRVSAVRTAGLPSSLGENNRTTNSAAVVACLKHEVTEEEADRMVDVGGPEDHKLPPPGTNRYQGFNTGVKECVQPDAGKSFVDALREEFQHTVYDSYWRKPVGRGADPTPMLPPGMHTITTLYGKPTPSDITAGELVNPPKRHVDVVEESRVGHEMYRRTHNDYDPGEQVARGYVAPYDGRLVFGAPTPCDPHGGCAKKVVNVGSNDKIFVSKILADYRNRSRPLVGKVLAPNNNIARVPAGHAFGKAGKREALGVGELMKDCLPSLDKIDLLEELGQVNTVRQMLVKQQPPPHRDILDTLHGMDPAHSGCLAMDAVYQVLSTFRVYPNRPLFDALLRRLGILCDNGMAHYERVVDVLNVNSEFPDLAKIDDVPKELMNFETTNQIAHKYHCSDYIGDIKNIRKAGIPPDPYLAIEGVVSPNLFTNYGLTPRDFFLSRSPEYLRTLFHRVGYDLDAEMFCEIWDLAKDEKGCVSVNSFYNVIKKCT